MDSFKGKYKRTSTENYEEYLKEKKYLKELDVNFLQRKPVTASTPVMEVSAKGRKVTAKVIVAGNKFVSEQKVKKDGRVPRQSVSSTEMRLSIP